MAKRKPTQAPLPWRGRDPKDGHDASKEKNAKKLMLMLIANSVFGLFYLEQLGVLADFLYLHGHSSGAGRHLRSL